MAKKKARAPKIDIKIRTKTMKKLFVDLPFTAQVLLNALLGAGKSRSHLEFSVEDLPPTANHMYYHTRFNTRLTEEAKTFREKTALAIGPKKSLFKCSGTACVMIFLENPHWITKRLTVREMDADNRVKPILDAVKHATGVPDETNWEIHVWKVASKNRRTTVYLFDLGDLVEFYT